MNNFDEHVANLHMSFKAVTDSKCTSGIFTSCIKAIVKPDGTNFDDIYEAIGVWGRKDQGSWDYENPTHFAVWYKYTWSAVKEKSNASASDGVLNGMAAAKNPDQQTQDAFQTSMSILANVVTNAVAVAKTDEIVKQIMSGVEGKVSEFITKTYGPIERKVTLHSELGEFELKGIQHEKFETVLKFVTNNIPVYLAGPAGSGKNVICKQVADALGLEFYFTNAVTQEYKLTGFTDANGRYHESQFYKAFKNGGLFMLDEMDASIPEVLIILNAAIANRYFDFPAPVGKIEAHKDFRVVAAGNTFGYGADAKYVGRNTLDAASLDRFALINVEYDDRISLAVTNNNSNLVSFCNRFRKAADKAGLQITVSYRAMERMAVMESLMSTVDVLNTCLIKGLEKDDIHIIRKGMRGSTKYDEALREIDGNTQEE